MSSEADLKLAEITAQKIRAYEEKASDDAYPDVIHDPFLTYLPDHERANLCRCYSKIHRVSVMKKNLDNEDDECRLII